MTMQEFGYTRGLPEGTETAWGCRAVVTDDKLVHVVRDRTSAVGPEIGYLLRYLHDLPLRGDWQNRASELLRAGVMDARVDEEFVLYADDAVVVKENTQASAGYLYVCAYFQPASDGRETDWTPPPVSLPPGGGRAPTHPASHDGCQTFQFLLRAWCVTHALELIEADPAEAEFIPEADITGLDGFLDLTPPQPGHVRLFVVEVDKEYALSRTDLTVPILLTRIVHKGEDLGCLVIDGWHRLYRARVEGRTSLPAYLLSADAERVIRIDQF
jgi:hypothetical protein